MAVRPIDANKLKKELAPYEENNFSQQIDVILKIVDIQPTLTPPNEWVSVETVAEILAENFGDECACNFNGNNEWLPEVCQYENTCPNPPERLGCWMEYLRHKYRRPPEGEEGDVNRG